MADRPFKSHTYQILEYGGNINRRLLRTVRCDDGTALYPGMVVTGDGHTHPDVGRLDAYGEIPVGILSLPADQDIDANFADDDELIAYMVGCGAIVWSKKVAACKVSIGEKMYADDGDSGWLIPAHMDGLEATGSLGYQIVKQYVGVSMETQATNASVRPLPVALI